MAPGPPQPVHALGPSDLEHCRAEADILLSFAKVNRAEGPGCYTPKGIDMWTFQESSMNSIAMNYNRRSTSYDGATWIYNDLKSCGTAVKVSEQATPRLKAQDAGCKRHALISSYKVCKTRASCSTEFFRQVGSR